MKIVFDKKFYDLNAVKNAAKAYEGLARFGFKNIKNEIQVLASDIDEDIKTAFKDEFCNFVLSETKKIKSHASGT